MGHYLWFLSVTNNGCHERSSAFEKVPFVVFSILLFSCIHYSIINLDNDKFCIERWEFKAMEIHAVRKYVVIMIYCRVLKYNSIHSAFSSFHKKFLIFIRGRDRHGRDCMEVGFATAYAISACHQ